jgi:hypothetical protein
MRQYLIRFGLWLAGLGGWTPCARPHFPDDSQIDLARQVVRDVAERFADTPGAFRHREAQRVLLNMRPGASTRDLNLLIELALQ